MLPERGNDFAVVLVSRLTLGWNHPSIQAVFARGRQAWCLRVVRDDNGDTRVRDAAGGNAGGNGGKIRAAPGEKNAEGMHG
jgi:hypothetical protein